MIKWIIIFVIFVIYSVVVFLCGRGYGNAENFHYINNLKMENMMLKNDLSLKSVEDDDEELQSHIDWINRFNKICSEEC
jgi:hypothetical protein